MALASCIMRRRRPRASASTKMASKQAHTIASCRVHHSPKLTMSDPEDDPLEESNDVDAANVANPAKKAAKKAAKKVSHKLRREEREDLVRSLEHVVAVGSRIRHTLWGTHRWKKSNRRKKSRKLGIRGNVPTIEKYGDQVDIPADFPPPRMHAEDVRIYGRTGRRQGNWPLKVPRRGPDDFEWDREHGDCIHPLAFVEARLSDIPPLKRQRVDGPNLSTDTTDCTVKMNEVPRAMLVRCWERAVHAAASTVYCDNENGRREAHPSTVQASSSTSVGEPRGESIQAEARRSDGQSAISNNTKYSSESAERKCQDLNIRLASGDGDRACPTCGIEFDSDEDLRKHFFGRANQRGCCWTKIRMEQYNLLDQVLQKEVAGCAEGLIRIAMANIDSRRAETGEDSMATSDWQDIMRFLESVHASSHVHEACSDPTIATLRHASKMLPLVLNFRTLQSLSSRLIERYTDMP